MVWRRPGTLMLRVACSCASNEPVAETIRSIGCVSATATRTERAAESLPGWAECCESGAFEQEQINAVSSRIGRAHWPCESVMGGSVAGAVALSRQQSEVGDRLRRSVAQPCQKSPRGSDCAAGPAQAGLGTNQDIFWPA